MFFEQTKVHLHVRFQRPFLHKASAFLKRTRLMQNRTWCKQGLRVNGRHNTQHNGTRHNYTQHNGTRLNYTQHNNKTNASLSITTTDKLNLTGRNLGRVFNSKLGQAFVYGVQLHT